MRIHRHSWALAAALLASCADYGAPDEVTYGEAVYTQPAPGADFMSASTYYLDPQFKLADTDVLGNPTVTDVALPANVINAIETNMAALGYAQIDTGNQDADLLAADVGLKVAVLKGSAAYYYQGYWCDYWYYYYCYYDWTYAGSYEYGTVILEMGDLSGFTVGGGDAPLPVMWLGAIYGVATSAVYDTPRIIDGINRAFGQSPYLDTHDATGKVTP